MPVSARAQPKAMHAYRVYGTEIDIAVIPDRACLSLLEVVLGPENKIKTSLTTIQEILSSPGRAAEIRCTEGPWLREFPKRDYEPPPGVEYPLSGPQSALWKVDLPYGVKRLLARYYGFTRTGGNPGSLNAFCKSYEALQLRDLKFQKAGWPVRAFDNDKLWRFAETYGLTEAEFSALYEYSRTAGAQEINSLLWRGKGLSPKLTQFKEMIASALGRLPDYSGMVTRAAPIPKSALTDYEVGKVVEFKGFTSTSAGTAWNRFKGDHFTIYGAKGKKISDFAAVAGEEEILFLPGTHFKVLSREAEGDHLDLVLVETDSQGKALTNKPAPLRVDD
jgi:ribosomal protein L21E